MPRPLLLQKRGETPRLLFAAGALMPKKPLDIEQVRQLVMQLPDVTEGTLHGAPSWKLKGKLLACPALHKSAEPNSLMVKIDPDERKLLLSANADVFYVTDHYVKNPVVLVRLSKINRKSLDALLRSAWEFLNDR